MFKNLIYLRFGPKEKFSFCRIGQTVVCTRRIIGKWYWVTRF
jgi:hypothetical protein